MRARRLPDLASANPAARRLIGALLASVALLALPVAQGLLLHHGHHYGGAPAGEPASPEVAGAEAGTSAEVACPICLAPGQARSGLAAPSGCVPAHLAVRIALHPGTDRGLAPAAVDVRVAGPRAPPHA